VESNMVRAQYLLVRSSGHANMYKPTMHAPKVTTHTTKITMHATKITMHATKITMHATKPSRQAKILIRFASSTHSKMPVVNPPGRAPESSGMVVFCPFEDMQCLRASSF